MPCLHCHYPRADHAADGLCLEHDMTGLYWSRIPRTYYMPPDHIAIGLPCYNRPRTMARAIDAIIAQTHTNWTLLISDNCSPNLLVERVGERYAAMDPRIKYVRQPYNIGLHANFQYVFEKHPRPSPLWMWAADDDIMDATYIETCLRGLTSGTVLSTTHIRRIDTDGSPMEASYGDPDWCMSGRTPLSRGIRYLLGHHGGGQQFYGIFRREVIGPEFWANRFFSYHSAMFHMMRRGGVAVSPQVLYTCQFRGNGWHRENFNQYYDSRWGKFAVTVSSTLCWWWELARVPWVHGYTLRDRLILSAVSLARLLHWRYIRRLAGDMRALVTRRDIWEW